MMMMMMPMMTMVKFMMIMARGQGPVTPYKERVIIFVVGLVVISYLQPDDDDDDNVKDHFDLKTLQELQMLSHVTLYCEYSDC